MIVPQEIYHPLYTDTEKFIILITGGRGSGKSFNASTFIERLTFEMTEAEKIVHQILYTRYTMVSAGMSIIPEMMEKIDLDGTTKYFKTTKTDIVNKMTKSRIMFRGIKTSSGNQTAKLKSIQGITTFVCDEAEEWTNEEEFDKIMLSIRKKGIQNRIIIIMNPCDSNHFIYKKYIENTHKLVEIDGVQVQVSTHPNVLHIHTTYLDNLDNLSPEFLKEVEDMKVNNPEKYAHVVIGRWADVAEGAVFKKWGIVDEFPEWCKRVAFGQDFGYTHDPSASIRCGIVDNALYLDEVDYRTGLLSGDIIKTLRPWGLKVIADSADPRLIQDIHNGGIKIYPVEKGLGSINAGIDKMQGMDIYITKRSYNPLAQVWEIVRNEDYGRELPGDMMIPKNGDTYVLSGFDTKFVSDAMIPDAENELKEKAQKYIAKSKVDPSTYENRMMPDSIYSEDGLYKLFDVGDRVNLINKTYFENGRQSRIIGFEYNLDIPYDHPVYTVGETASYSRIGELEGKLESLTLAGQTYTGGRGSGIYVIRTNDSTPAGNGNVFSALRSLATFLCKNKPDRTNFLLKLLGGAEVGEATDSMLAGKGTILTKDGRIQTDRLEVRGYLKVMELLFNRVLAQEADFTFSESGTIEKVEPQADGTYNLTMRKRHDTDFTAFAEQDVAYGAVNTLVTAGEYYTSWFRVLSVNTVANTVNAVLYPDGEVPGGQNFPPSVGMVITRRGNAVNEERQSYWYLSGYEHCICMLDGVTKPVLEENNYSVIIGKLKNLSLFDNLPINYRHSYIYCRGIAIQDLLRVDYQGNPIVQLNDRGAWSAEVAASDQPYTIGREYADTVWHYGCRWKCLMSGTLSEPNYASAGWAMIEGNPEFTIDIDSSNGFEFDYDDFATVLTLTGKIYNRDITSFLLDTDIAWTRDTGNVSEDNAWAVKRSGAGKTLPLTLDDLGPDHTTLGKCFFKATALLRDGEVTNEAEAVINF